jgi:CxxC motif-containing protein (DUF1111 family)
VPTLTTDASPITVLNHVTFAPYSDFLLHDMGALGDGIQQGQASGTEMRTTPLWGLAVRERYLHDGRTADLTEAILAHDGQAEAARASFQALSADDVAALLAFLQSL